MLDYKPTLEELSTLETCVFYVLLGTLAESAVRYVIRDGANSGPHATEFSAAGILLEAVDAGQGTYRRVGLMNHCKYQHIGGLDAPFGPEDHFFWRYDFAEAAVPNRGRDGDLCTIRII